MMTSDRTTIASLRAGALVAALLSTAAPLAVHAQDQAQSDDDMAASAQGGEIVVTALKGNVSTQKAPVTVNVVSGDVIVNQGITSTDQLTSAVPGVRINQAPGGTINPVVRGLGSSPSNVSFEQTIGLFVDGIFAGHPRDYSAALFDLDRVELLKGTQAAVVGKNTSVGAIALVTRKPDFELGGSASYYHEFNLGTDTFNGAFNLPASDTLAFRIAGLYSNEGGWMDAVFGGPDQPENRKRAVRATMRFKPSSDLDWTISAQRSTQKMTGQYFRIGIDTLGNAAINAAAAGDTTFVLRRRETRVSDRPGYSYRGLDGVGQETEGTRFNSTLTYELGSLTLSAITGYSRYTDKFIIDATSTRNAPAIRGGFERNKSFSQELRLATDSAKPLRLITGLYYYNDTWFYEDDWDFVGPPVFGLGGAFNSSLNQKTKTFSAFGQVTYELTDQLQVAVGARYENFKKSADYSARVVTRAGGLTNLVYGAYAPFSMSNSDDFFDYSVQAQYFISPAVNVYASYATGTKGFGYVGTPTAAGGVARNPFFDNEESRTIEAGVKAQFGRGSRLNLAFFDTKIKNYQIGINLGTNFVIRNDQIRSRGVEATLDLRLVEGLSASVTATYADVKKLPPLPTNPSIATLPYAPKLSGIATLNYDTPINDEFQFKGNVTAEFRSSQFLNDVSTFPGGPVAGRVRTDLRLAVEHKPKQVELALVVRNLFDVYGLAYGFNQFGAAGAAQVAEEMPRTIGLQASVRF